MAEQLEHIEDMERKQKFGQNLKRLRNKEVTQENYQRVKENMVEPVLSQIDDIIANEQKQRQEHEAEVEQVKQTLGPQLQRGRENGNEHPELGESGAFGEVYATTRRIEDWLMLRNEYVRVWNEKVIAVLDMIDAQDIWNRTYEHMTEEVGNEIEDVKQDMKEFKEQVRDERKEYRRLQREERKRHRTLLSEMFEQGLAVLESLGQDVDELREKINNQLKDDIPLVAEGTATESAASESQEQSAGVESLYHFEGKSVEEQQEELRRMVETERVDDLSEQEIVERINVSHARFFDEDDGILVAIEDAFGDEYPEFRDQDT